VLGLDERDVLVAVGDQRELPPIGPQLGVGSAQARATDDQPAAAVPTLMSLDIARSASVGLSFGR
jgi:hypothetical protein